ncbi:MAG: phosphoribosylanthranilate isomerase [Pseudomonadota bacterium]|nr:phosphoribosylanthranilate isomerase [Pseudomonadota bacterium]
MRTRIKICGVRSGEDIAAAAAAGADAIGFVFYAASSRAISVARAGELARALPPLLTPVGLFVNAAAEEVEAACAAIPDLLLQFHGDETAAECQLHGRPYLKAVRMRTGVSLPDIAQRYASARGIVLDADVEGYGGGGQRFDWSLVPAALSRPMVLSGGLTADNVAAGIERLRPWAVDVSSGVESSRGVKDAAAIHRFCAAVRAADAGALSLPLETLVANA